MAHMLYIPTHRPSAEAIGSFSDESSYIGKKLDRDWFLAVIEATEAPFVRDHAQLLGSSVVDGVPVFHVTVERFREFAHKVTDAVASSDAERLLLRRLLQPRGVSYGAGPNKAALLGAALGVDVLHRRDSDTAAATESNGDVRFPGELEVEAIGQPVGDLATRNEVGTPGRTVLVVASAYAGDPPLDRQALMRHDMALARRVERLGDPGSSDDALDRAIQEYFVDEPNRRYDGDFFEIDETGKTEMGVSCVAAVWRELPEMPIEDTLGGDYMQKNLMYRFDVPVVFHSRKVNHFYGEERRDPAVADAVSYALRDLRYLLLWRIWSVHNRTLQSDPAAYWSEPHTLDQAAYAASFASAVDAVPREELRGIVQEFAAVHDDAAQQATGKDELVFAEIARRSHDQESLSRVPGGRGAQGHS